MRHYSTGSKSINSAKSAQAVFFQNHATRKYQAAKLDSMAIAQTKKLELALLQAQEVAKAKSEFIANMSHEIRTPMNGILGIAELLSNSKLSDAQQQLVRVLQSSGQFLMSLMNDILDFSKIEAGKLELESIPFSLSALLDEIKDVFILQTNARNLELTLNYQKDLPELMLGDTTRLKQVFFNLISNAIKFTPQGKIAIKLTSTHVPNMYEVTISDTGVGMSLEVTAKLFSAFTQANASIARQYGGTGLGLTICERLVKLMKGRIWVESEENKGTSFHFTFCAPEVIPTSNAAPIVPQSDKGIRDLNVLVVDDQAVNRFLVIKFLNNLGINPDIANDGFEALQRIEMSNYDVVLMDLERRIQGRSATRFNEAWNTSWGVLNPSRFLGR